MQKRLIATLLVTALLAPGCQKKSADPAAGSGAAGLAGTGSAGAPASDSPITLSPAVVAAGALATSTQQASAEAVRALAAAPAGVKVTQLDKLLDATIAAATREARDRSWDPATVVASVGGDRAKLFAWVREQTALVPYAGTLRGAIGVMMDRVGNSLDRSLLLADLLTRAGGDVRLAHVTLEPAAAETLAAAWSKAARPAFPATPEDPTAIANLVAAIGGDRTALDNQFAARAAARADIAAKARAQIDAQAGVLARTIEAAPAPAATDPAVLADHWWVQARDGDAWLDLDPTQDAPGKVLAPAAETLARDAVPDGLRHVLAIRVIGEVWHGDAREEATLVEHAFAPADFYGQRVMISTVPLDLPDPDKLDTDKDRAGAARTALAAQTEWVAMIRIGVTPVVRFSVTDAGELYDLMDPNGNTNRLARVVQQATKNGAGGATQMFEGMADGTDPVPPTRPAPGPHSGFTAEWIELEVRAPNVAPRIVRRTVFDALGAPADRGTARPVQLSGPAKLDRGLALLGETEVLAQFARIPHGFVANRLANYLTAAKPAILALVQGGGKSPPEAITTALNSALPPPDELDDLALLRFAWSAADRVFVDQLDVLTAQRRLVSVTGTLRTRQVFDIVTNGVGSWGTPAEARSARLAQGIADTVAESVLRPCSPASGPCFRGPNTSDAFVGAKDWALITDPSSPMIAALPAAARAVATSDLANGYAIVAAPDGRSATWWRVRLETGETLGQAALGGSVSAETLNLIAFLKGAAIGTGWGFCYISSSGWHLFGCVVAVGIGGAGSFVTNQVVAAVLGLVAVLIGGGSSIVP